MMTVNPPAIPSSVDAAWAEGNGYMPRVPRTNCQRKVKHKARAPRTEDCLLDKYRVINVSLSKGFRAGQPVLRNCRSFSIQEIAPLPLQPKTRKMNNPEFANRPRACLKIPNPVAADVRKRILWPELAILSASLRRRLQFS